MGDQVNISDLVESTLRDDPFTRDSDKELLLQVWDRLGFNLTHGQREQFRKLPSAETIRRIRQKIQEKGLYPAAPFVRIERKLRSLRMQQITPAAKPKYIEQVIEPEQQLLDVLDHELKKDMPR